MMEQVKPAGGKWSFDAENRKKLPSAIQLPELPQLERGVEVNQAIEWVEGSFPQNFGEATAFNWPTTHHEAKAWFGLFQHERFELFGPYEDAMAEDESFLFHSALSSSLNIGLLSPHYVVDEALAYAAEHKIPIASLEGFIRQIIGWREYMRATYVLDGRRMRTQNHLKFSRKLDEAWWHGTTGLVPIDAVVQRINKTAYAHHIERLMIIGNAMLLLRIDPEEVYEWFMSLFIDAYDWVMVPNVYAMSQFAAGELITTKPYMSGSSYINKMGRFKRGEWTRVWDALYWQFVHDHRELLGRNHRARMMVSLLDRMDAQKRSRHFEVAGEWLKD